MNYYLNDLSLNQGGINVEPEKVILQFLNICKTLLDYRFEKLVVPKGFKDIPIADGITIKGYWDLHNGSDISRRLKSLFQNSLDYMDEETRSEEIQRMEDVTYNSTSSNLLCNAYQSISPVVSLDTNTAFHSHILNIVYHFIENDNYDSKNVTVINICLSSHFNTHQQYLEAKRLGFIKIDANWNASKTPFLLVNETKAYLDGIPFTQNNEGLNGGQRIAKYLGIGSRVALLNGWLRDYGISAKNHSENQIRRIFKSRGKRAMYLSIDIQHGEFELFDETGEHQSVYSFYGERLNKEVDKTTHKLIVI